MFNPSREQVRRLFIDTWRKYRQREPLEGIETLAIEVILLHPEYQSLLADPARHLDRDYLPEMGETNPFLHMSLHLALLEQLSIDQPPGVRARHQALRAKLKDGHDAQHAMIECLAEMLWQAQRHHTQPDARLYLECMDARLGARG